jgi:hypothetical protein
MQISHKKISDIKISKGPDSPRTTIKTGVVSINKEIQDRISKKSEIITPTLKTPERINNDWKKIFITLILIFFICVVLYVLSLLSYHAKVTITPQKQNLSLNTSVAAVPIGSFSGQLDMIPYYRYITSNNVLQSYEQMLHVIPDDAITDPEYMFLSDTERGIIFFKKSDIIYYLEKKYIDHSYQNRVININQITIKPTQGITPYNHDFTVQIQGPFTAESVWNKEVLTNSLLGVDKYICKEKAVYIPEINIDKCTVFPFWYKKIPKNPQFVRIIVK